VKTLSLRHLDSTGLRCNGFGHFGAYCGWNPPTMGKPGETGETGETKGSRYPMGKPFHCWVTAIFFWILPQKWETRGSPKTYYQKWGNPDLDVGYCELEFLKCLERLLLFENDFEP